MLPPETPFPYIEIMVFGAKQDDAMRTRRYIRGQQAEVGFVHRPVFTIDADRPSSGKRDGQHQDSGDIADDASNDLSRGHALDRQAALAQLPCRRKVVSLEPVRPLVGKRPGVVGLCRISGRPVDNGRVDQGDVPGLRR